MREDKFARPLKATLDAGDAEAIALALEVSADLILFDERDGRVAAERVGLRLTGVLGILLRAMHDGQIQSVKPAAARSSLRSAAWRPADSRRLLPLRTRLH